MNSTYIDSLWRRIAAVHKRYPEQRISQFLMNLTESLGKDPFYMNDEEFVAELEKKVYSWEHPQLMQFNVEVKIDLIEWYADDVGQYQEQGLPRSLDCLKLVVKADKLTEDAIGDEILSLLEKSYKIKPVLVSWDRISE